MSVHIKGLKYLNENDYKKLIIVQKSSEYMVQAFGYEDELPKIKSTTKWSDNLKDKNDADKIKTIINYYLENCVIDELIENQIIPYYRTLFHSVNGTRTLHFNLYSEDFKDIYNSIRTKYYNDRLNIVNENKDIKYYSITMSKDTSNIKLQDSNLGPSMELTLLSYRKYIDGGKSLIEPEKMFLQDFLYTKLNEVGELATIEDQNLYEEDSETHINLGYFITCGDLCIGINNIDLLPDVMKIVNNYNNNITKEKKKQLKLEGF